MNFNDIKWRTADELLTCNSSGHASLFDVRTDKSWICIAEQNGISFDSLAISPTNPEIVATGTENGTLSLWDLRHPNYPISSVDAHTLSGSIQLISAWNQIPSSEFQPDLVLFVRWNFKVIILNQLLDINRQLDCICTAVHQSKWLFRINFVWPEIRGWRNHTRLWWHSWNYFCSACLMRSLYIFNKRIWRQIIRTVTS